jgi:predicted NBD/HSP70 family sugar kinase
VCVDVGSTYTKAALIDLDGGELVARAEVPTTSGSDVLTGLDQAVAEVGGGDEL